MVRTQGSPVSAGLFCRNGHSTQQDRLRRLIIFRQNTQHILSSKCMTASFHDHCQDSSLTWWRHGGMLREHTSHDRFSFAAGATVLVRRCTKRTTDQRYQRTIESGRLVMDSQPSSRPGGTEARPIREDQASVPYLYTIRTKSWEVKLGGLMWRAAGEPPGVMSALTTGVRQGPHDLRASA